MLFDEECPRRAAEGDQDDARERAADVGDVDREERAAVQVAEHDAERQGDQQRDPEGRARELQVLQRLVPEQAGVVADEPDRVGERPPARRSRREGGSRASPRGQRAAQRATSRASAASASRIARPPAAMISVLKTSCPIPMKIGCAEPFRDHERGDRGDRDRRHGRDPQAGDDRRQGERQLDAEQRLPACQTHAREPPRWPPRARRASPRGCSGTGSAACRRRARSRPSSPSCR